MRGNVWKNRKEFKVKSSDLDMDIRQQVVNAMRNPNLYIKGIIRYVEENVEDAFNICCRKNLTINEWKLDSSFGKQINQKTVLLTVRMFDLWETALIDVLNSYLGTKFKGVRVIHTHDSKGDLTIVLPNGEKIVWEIKTTQAKDAWTGATHSASKYNDYILISYDINKDLKLQKGTNKGFLLELAVIVWDNMEAKWRGEPSKKSSWTTLKIPSEIKEIRPEIIVVGNLEPKKKWCKIIRTKL